MVFNSVTIFNNDSVIDLDIKIAIDHYYRAGLILTKNPFARKDSNYISVVPIVLLSSLRFFCTC